VGRLVASRPDVAVLDLQLPDGSGIDVCREVRSQSPGTYCLMLTSFHNHEAMLSALLAGASGYVLKDVRMTGLVDAIRTVALGRSLIDPTLMAALVDRVRNGSAEERRIAELTPREREVFDMIAEGLSNRQIGERLFLAEKTVKNYVTSLLTKLELQRRTQVAVLAAEMAPSNSVWGSGIRA
jgi:two-component system response regulator DevR